MASYPKRRSGDAANSSKKKPNTVAWFGILALAILAGGAVLANLTKKEKDAERDAAAARAAQDSAAKPFADMPAETPPAKSGGGGFDASKPFGGLDAGNLGSPEAAAVWLAAVALAEDGEAQYQAAVAAKTAGDVEALNQAGAAAKAKFNEATEATALLETELIAERGESDPTVRALMKARSTWFARLDWLLKSTGR